MFLSIGMLKIIEICEIGGGLFLVCVFFFLVSSHHRMNGMSNLFDHKKFTIKDLPMLIILIFSIFYLLLRHVVLPKELLKQVPKSHLMKESEWRAIGVQQSRGWIHYMIHTPEPHILLFRRPITSNP